MEHSHRKRRRSSEARTRGKICVVGEAKLMHVAHQHGVSDRRVFDLIRVLHPLDDRVDQLVAVVKEARQMPHADVAVLIKCRRKHGAAVLLKIVLKVRAAAEKRHAEGCSGNDHFPSPEINSTISIA